MQPSKTCVACGREITWRKKWARDWAEVKFCSAGCRRQRTSPEDDALEVSLLALLGKCPGGATICPSDAAKAVGRDTWQDLREPARAAARRLAAAGLVEITQSGRVVDPSTAKGPIRIRRLD